MKGGRVSLLVYSPKGVESNGGGGDEPKSLS